MAVSEQNFRILLFQLAERLEQHDLDGITYIYELPASFENQSALKILMKLEMMGVIAASDPSKLEDVFKAIKRIDLVKKVKEYKKKKKSTPKTNSEISFDANVEVALTQTRLVKDQIEHLQRIECSRAIEATIIEASELSEKLQKKLLSLKEQHQSTYCCSDSDNNLSPPDTINRKNSPFNLELQQQVVAGTLIKKRQSQSPPKSKSLSSHLAVGPLLPLSLVTHPISSRVQISQEESDADQYTEVWHKTPVPNSILVAGTVLTKPTEGGRQKPTPPPKPTKLQRAKSKEFLEEEPEYKEVERREDKDESGYGGTGDDQEFTDPTPYLKDNLDSPLPVSSSSDDAPGHYKALQREGMDKAGYYKLPSRGNNKPMKGGHDELKKYKDEAIYENSGNTF